MGYLWDQYVDSLNNISLCAHTFITRLSLLDSKISIVYAVPCYKHFYQVVVISLLCTMRTVSCKLVIYTLPDNQRTSSSAVIAYTHNLLSFSITFLFYSFNPKPLINRGNNLSSFFCSSEINTLVRSLRKSTRPNPTSEDHTRIAESVHRTNRSYVVHRILILRLVEILLNQVLFLL